MKFPRLLGSSLLAFALLLSVAQMYSVVAVTAAKKERSVHSNKPVSFQYVCPMHEDVTSKKAGLCPKCKMKLVRQPLSPKPSQ
jgi:Heavy metal binding domain